MLLERYYDDTLAQASYLVACEQTGDAIIVDPNRDIETYIQAAASHRFRIRYVAETHIHADFLSGSRELARSSGATVVLSEHGGEDWGYRYANDSGAMLVRDGATLAVGNVQLRVLHTPGHTPEHISFLVADTALGDRPMGMLSGDFLFVGDVGRPDLLEKTANVAGSMEKAARQLFASLQRLSTLPDYLQIWPGHGAGSACGKALGSVPQSTLGYERLYNPALQQSSEDAFAEWVLTDQPEPPRYFAEMKRLNRDGPPPRRKTEPIPQLDATAIQNELAQRHWVVDVRSSADFGRAHIPGTINIPASKSVATYAGTVLSYDRPIVILARAFDQATRVARQLALIGLDQVVGWSSADSVKDMRSQGGQLAAVSHTDPRALAERLDRDGGGPRVIDVRGRSEWNHGHLPKAHHIFLGNLMDRAQQMGQDEEIVVHCESGTRASIAASLLMSRGFTDVSTLAGGFGAWRKAGLPIISDNP